MTVLGLLAVLAGLLAATVAFVRRTDRAMFFFALAYMLHVASAVAFYKVVQTSPSDSSMYYYDPYSMYPNGFGFNTQFIIWLVQGIKLAVGGSFLDYFLVFQAIGFFGIALLMRTFEEIYDELGTTQPIWIYGLLLLPSLQYWSSSLGKDAPFLFAGALALWSAMRIKRRFIGFAAASLIMLLIRPHLAVLAIVSLAVAVILDRKTSFTAKIALGGAGALGVVYAISATMESLSIDLTSADVISDRMAAREQLLTTEAAGASVVSGSFPIRLFSLLARPFFFDARDPLAMIASLENVGVLFMIGLLLWHMRAMIALFRRVPFVRYALIYFLALTILLAFEYYNVGLGLRQKWTMMMPNLYVVVVALLAVLGADARRRALQNRTWAEAQWQPVAVSRAPWDGQ